MSMKPGHNWETVIAMLARQPSWETNRSKGGSRNHIRRQNGDRGKGMSRIGIKEVVFGDLRQAEIPAALRYASRQKITKFTWFDSLILMKTRGSWRGEKSKR